MDDTQGTVLVVDDNDQSRRLAVDVLESAGFSVLEAGDGESCLEITRRERPDVIILDRVMPGLSGDEVAGLLKEDEVLSGIKIIMLSAKTSPDEKVAGLNLGADDYLAKPYHRQELMARVKVHLRTKRAEDALQVAFTEVEQIVRDRTAELVIANAKLQEEVIERKRAEEGLREALQEVEQLKNRYQAESSYLTDELKYEHNFEDIVGASGPLANLLRKVEQVAPTNATVLILGESGTGKELVARAIHSRSPRAERPLVKVNCAVLPENLIESELFGHEKGAFTGAIARKVGRFELADGGTIFLDEIGELPLGLQSKLLRVVQEGEFERLGSAHTQKVDVRLIAATNRDLAGAMALGEFREDLYYRLNVFPLLAPPLRERKADIPLIASHFAAKFASKIGKPAMEIPADVLSRLHDYHWPGNVRELENIIERAMILSDGPQLTLEESFPAHSPPQARPGRQATMQEIEKEGIVEALQASGWVVEGKNGAAQRLGLHPSTLRSRMLKLEIAKPG